MERCQQIYYTLSRFKEEQECLILYPEPVTTTSDHLDQLGITDDTPGYIKSPPLSCYQSTKRRLRVDSDSGALFRLSFWLLIYLTPGVQEITDRCMIYFNEKSHRILEFDHDRNELYWRVRLQDED